MLMMKCQRPTRFLYGLLQGVPPKIGFPADQALAICAIWANLGHFGPFRPLWVSQIIRKASLLVWGEKRDISHLGSAGLCPAAPLPRCEIAPYVRNVPDGPNSPGWPNRPVSPVLEKCWISARKVLEKCYVSGGNVDDNVENVDRYPVDHNKDEHVVVGDADDKLIRLSLMMTRLAMMLIRLAMMLIRLALMMTRLTRLPSRGG